MKRITDIVNVFQGNGKIDLPKPEGIASKWLFVKAQAGNTNPHASYPFGKMSVGAYTGGYPTGYGNLRPNSCGEPKTFDATLHGFTHIHQTGTGSIGFYYNYALTSPVSELGEMNDTLEKEYAEPGYYSAVLRDSGAVCEMTVNEAVAHHRYKMTGDGYLQIDMSNEGCSRSFAPKYHALPKEAEIEIVSSNIAHSRIVTKGGINIYFVFKCDEASAAILWKDYKEIQGQRLVPSESDSRYGFAFRVPSDSELKVAYSFIDFESAEEQLDKYSDDFDAIRKKTSDVWEDYLSRIEIDADDDLQEIFYSNLYHSLIKPSYALGESFVDNLKYFDFSTLWDVYKTQLPLVFTLCKNEAEGIIKTFISACQARERSPIRLPIARTGDVSNQARMLMEHSFADYYFRYGGEYAREMLDATEKDLRGQTAFLESGLCERYTHVLDISGALGAMAEIAREIGDSRADYFDKLSGCWRNVFDKETGLMSTKSTYYEGNNYNYSFRPIRDMDERMMITGNKQDFIDKLDELFGYTREPVELPTASEIDPLELGINSFEGFNNESDMEAPYAYIYLDKHDKTSEIVRGGLLYMFSKGRGGIPGNNDSGTLSSFYVWAALGLFPVSSQNLLFVTAPLVKRATLKLGTGRELEIIAHGASRENMYVERIEFNGREVTDYRIGADEMMSGGRLEIWCKSTPNK